MWEWISKSITCMESSTLWCPYRDLPVCTLNINYGPLLLIINNLSFIPIERQGQINFLGFHVYISDEVRRTMSTCWIYKETWWGSEFKGLFYVYFIEITNWSKLGSHWTPGSIESPLRSVMRLPKSVGPQPRDQEWNSGT